MSRSCQVSNFRKCFSNLRRCHVNFASPKVIFLNIPAPHLSEFGSKKRVYQSCLELFHFYSVESYALDALLLHSQENVASVSSAWADVSCWRSLGSNHVPLVERVEEDEEEGPCAPHWWRSQSVMLEIVVISDRSTHTHSWNLQLSEDQTDELQPKLIKFHYMQFCVSGRVQDDWHYSLLCCIHRNKRNHCALWADTVYSSNKDGCAG